MPEKETTTTDTDKMNEDTQEQMVPFNFKEPFNVTVTFDDSDDDDEINIQKQIEESSRLIEKRKEDNVIDNNNISSPNLNLINEREENSVTKPTSAHPELKRKIHCENKQSIPIQSKKTKKLKTKVQKKTQANTDSLMNCKDDLLKTFIEHITYIMEAHQLLVVFPFRNKDTKNVKYQEFKKRKYHLFELSYCTVKCLLVPFEQDPNVMTNLMQQILKTVNEKNGINCYSLKDLQKLFEEMIAWTKEKMRRLQSKGFTMNDNSHTQFTSGKNGALKESHIIQPSFSSAYAPKNLNAKEPNTCLLSCGPLNNPLNIGIDTSTLNIYQTQHPNLLTASSNKNQIENRQNYHYTQNCIPERYQIPEYSQPVYKHKNNSHLIRLLNEHPQHLPKTLPRYYDIYKDLIESSKSFSTPDSFTVTGNQVAAETSRSKSTDSGFVSPPPFAEQFLNNIPEKQNTAATPYVTHVTSLNPDAKHLNYGACFICGKTTNKMCVGCFKHYYCSHKCQEVHWYFHKYYCNNKESYIAQDQT